MSRSGSEIQKSIEYFEKFGSILGLERIVELLKRLGNPHKELKVIHVAGTNGKGSVSRYIYEMIRAGNYSVGIYTSPYIEVFNERIEVDGKYIRDEELSNLLKEVTEVAKDMEKDGCLVPTEFDIITAVAFMYYKQQNVDYVVLEVGLGGRLDSTNVIENPLMTVITSISLDHTDRIGSTLAEIAFEKAGIIKHNAPVVVGELPKDALEVIVDKAEKMNSEIIVCSTDTVTQKSHMYGSEFTLKDVFEAEEENFEISMIGFHQIMNGIVAIKTIEKLILCKKIELNMQQIKSGMKKAKVKGRFEVLNKGRYNLILDGAHNEAGMNAFVKTVQGVVLNDDKGTSIQSKEYSEIKKILVVCGFLKDKDTQKMADILCNLQRWCNDEKISTKEYSMEFVATEPDNERSLSGYDLKKLLEKRGCTVLCEDGVAEIMDKIESKEYEYDTIIFVGSLYLIGQVRRMLTENKGAK